MKRSALILAAACLCGCPRPRTDTPPAPVSFASISDFQVGPAAQSTTSQICIQPGLYAIGNYAFPAAIGGCVTFAGGSGDAKIYVDEDGQLVTAMRTGIKVSAETAQMTHVEVDTPMFPPTALPICDLTVTDGAYTVDACGLATRVRNNAIKVGYGLKLAPVNGKTVIEVDPAQLPTRAPPEPTPASGFMLPVWFPAASLRADKSVQIGSAWVNKPAESGAELGAFSGNTHNRAYLIFPPGKETFAQLSYLLPDKWDGTVGARIAWQSADLAAAGSLFDLRIAIQCHKPNVRFNAGNAWSTEQSSTNGITGLDVHADEDWQIARLDAMAMGSCAAGDLLSIQFRQHPAGLLTVEARLFGVELLVGIKP